MNAQQTGRASLVENYSRFKLQCNERINRCTVRISALNFLNRDRAGVCHFSSQNLLATVFDGPKGGLSSLSFLIYISAGQEHGRRRRSACCDQL